MLLDYLEGPASRAGTAWLLPHMRRSVPRGDGGALLLNSVFFIFERYRTENIVSVDRRSEHTPPHCH